MPTAIHLVPMSHETSFAPLGVLGYCLTRSGFLTPLWQDLDLPLKTVDYLDFEQTVSAAVRFRYLTV